MQVVAEAVHAASLPLVETWLSKEDLACGGVGDFVSEKMADCGDMRPFLRDPARGASGVLRPLEPLRRCRRLGFQPSVSVTRRR